MSLAGYGGKDHFEYHKAFLSWGFGTAKKKFGICNIDKAIYYHKYTDRDLNCFWDYFVQHRNICNKNETDRTEDEIKRLEQSYTCK